MIYVLDGIAGSGKSTLIDSRLSGIEYGRYTATNRLKHESEIRFPSAHNDTIAAGLFRNLNGTFYTEEKDPVYKYTVIDELLLSDVKVFDWIFNHKDETTIIITTDSHQTLTPKTGELMLRMYEDMVKRDDVHVTTLTHTHRAKTRRTADIYKAAYDSVLSDVPFFGTLDVPYLQTLEYEPTTAYITHTKLQEKKLYDRWNLYDRYDLELIPKGSIAKRPPKDPRRYPILPQILAEEQRRAGYWQVANIATATRYQGSECDHLVFVYGRGDVISNREYYTVLSRVHDIGNFAHAIIEAPRPDPIRSFKGRPVLDVYVGRIPEDTKLLDGSTVQSHADKSGTMYVDPHEFNVLLTKAEPVPGTALDQRRIKCGMRMVYPKSSKELSNTRTIPSLMKRDAVYTYDMDTIYRILDEHNVSYVHSASLDSESKWYEHEYGLDLKSAYPYVMHNCSLPITGDISTEPVSGYLDYYVVKASERVLKDCIVTAPLAEFLKAHNLATLTYLFSLPCKKGGRMESYLYECATTSKETSKKIKGMHYGYIEKPFLYPSKYGFGRAVENTHAPLMWAIKSNLALIMLQLSLLLDSRSVQVDCIYFDNYTEDLGPTLKTFLAPYDFRIFKQTKKDVEVIPGAAFRLANYDRTELYASYSLPDVKKRSHHKK